MNRFKITEYSYILYGFFPGVFVRNMFFIMPFLIYTTYPLAMDRGCTVVKVLYYKSEGRWFDSRWCRNFSLT